MGGWAGAECLRLPTTWVSAQGPQLCRACEGNTCFSPASEGETSVPWTWLAAAWTSLWPSASALHPQPPAGVHVLNHDRRAGRQMGPHGPGGEPRPWLATWPRPPGSGLAAHSRGGRPGLPAAPSGCTLGRAPGQWSGAPTLPRSKHALPQLSCGRGLRLPGPQRGWPLSAHSFAERAVRLWDYAMQAGLSCQVCVLGGWAGGWRTALGTGLTLREGAVPQVCATPPPRCTLATRAGAGCGLHPHQQQLLSVGDAIFLWDILVPREGGPQAGKCLPSLEPARPLWAPAAPKHTGSLPVASAVSGCSRAPTCEAGGSPTLAGPVVTPDVGGTR